MTKNTNEEIRKALLEDMQMYLYNYYKEGVDKDAIIYNLKVIYERLLELDIFNKKTNEE